MCFSRAKVHQEAPLDQNRVNELIEKYAVTEAEIDKCWRAFVELDSSGDGFIEREDLFRGLQQKKHYVAEYFFNAIGFKPGVPVQLETLFDPLFSFMLLWRSQIIQIVFDELDTEGTGWIQNAEMQHRMSKFLNVDAYSQISSSIQQCVEDADADSNGQIVLSEFTTLVNKLPRLLLPIFQMQVALQNATLGRRVWENKIEAAILADQVRFPQS